MIFIYILTEQQDDNNVVVGEGAKRQAEEL